VQQFNCVVGDTVLLATRKGGKGRWKTERLTIAETGIRNSAGHPLDFMAADANGRRIQLSPFTNEDARRVIVIPPVKKLPRHEMNFWLNLHQRLLDHAGLTRSHPQPNLANALRYFRGASPLAMRKKRLKWNSSEKRN